MCWEVVGERTSKIFPITIACNTSFFYFCLQDMMDKANAEAGEVMQCLIENKNNAEMNRKCATGIEHHQLVCYTSGCVLAATQINE